MMLVNCSPGADWIEVVPETERLDTSAHRARAHLAQRSKRQPPSRSKLKETLSSPTGRAQVTKSSRYSGAVDCCKNLIRLFWTITLSLTLDFLVCFSG